MRAAFAERGFSLLYAGLVASMLGDSLMLIVLAVWVKDLTGSNGAAGATFFWLALPALVAPARSDDRLASSVWWSRCRASALWLVACPCLGW